ncbi:MAG: glutamate synthase-related protein, partial [Bdellovibrionota bacterium]
MIVVDLEKGELVSDATVKSRVANHRPFAEWCRLENLELDHRSPALGSNSSLRLQLRLFGYTDEEIRMILEPMCVTGEEPTSSMGNDTPLAVLSDRPQVLSRYFRQLFAQVTNPPIDPIREKLVMSIATYLGSRPSPFAPGPSGRKNIRLDHPILDAGRIAALRAQETNFAVETVDLTFPADRGELAFATRLEEICQEAKRLASKNVDVLILSDRNVTTERASLPPLLATSAVHHSLIRAGLRTRLSLVVETGESRDVHDFACLIGFGADAIHPYLVFDLIRGLRVENRLADEGVATSNYLDAIGKGLLTVISKMGIATLQSYCGAQTFEIIGISSDVVETHFTGTTSRLGGLGLTDIAKESLVRHRVGVDSEGSELGLPSAGVIHYRVDGETHFWNPSTLTSLQIAARSNSSTAFDKFSQESNALTTGTLRGLLKLKSRRKPIPISDVESTASIVKRFTTGAMSFGSLSIEAHEVLALAMNRIGAKSNSGEGGEGSERFLPNANGESKNSAIKQVASGRFGVTIDYLGSASELQIKIAQGAKPGEGGKLPGHKVNDEIAKLRHSIAGVTLISPPPHHDIYSIEDLKQLIFDLRKANPSAAISVKLVAAAGIGTIAAGVVKAGADKILVSGDGGGTGASPLSSIKHAGSPWELGLAEVHQALVMQGLRSRVRLETDGQLKTGRDVVIAALLGAEEFGFGTAALVAAGC